MTAKKTISCRVSEAALPALDCRQETRSAAAGRAIETWTALVQVTSRNGRLDEAVARARAALAGRTPASDAPGSVLARHAPELAQVLSELELAIMEWLAGEK